MSFIKRAQDAASSAADAARVKAGEAAAMAGRTAGDPATQEKLGRQAKEAMGMARRGISTVVERIDPGTLAEVIVKATALQEMTNSALRAKDSPYRISEISIAATIPPGVTFAIGRIDDMEEHVSGTLHSSEELVEQLDDTQDAVIALDGTTFDQAEIDAARAMLAADLPDPVDD